MQYKIPVQIENEDPIIIGLSLRQLSILMGFWAIWYMIFNGLNGILPTEIAAAPWIILLLLGFLIAKFKHSWMTFVQFILSFMRFKANIAQRHWIWSVDSFHPFDIWYIKNSDNKQEEEIDFSSKIDKIQELEQKLENI